MYAGTIPSDMGLVTTANSGSDVVVTWDAPTDTGGLGISSYTIEFKYGSNYASTTDCDAALALSTNSCTVPMTTFTAPPYSLVINDSIIARIKATNAIGSSSNWSSDSTSYAVVQTSPDQVTNLANDSTVTNDTRIKITFDALTGDATGGASIVY